MPHGLSRGGDEIDFLGGEGGVGNQPLHHQREHLADDEIELADFVDVRFRKLGMRLEKMVRLSQDDIDLKLFALELESAARPWRI